MANPTLLGSTKSSSDYSYINARIHGMRAHLLTPAQIQELLLAKDLSDVIEVLKNTHFSHHFQILGDRPTPEMLQEIIRRDLMNSVQALLSLLEGRPRFLFETLLLYWDMETIRALLRGKFKKRPSSEILASTLPVGRLTEPLIEELLQAPDIASVLHILYLWKFPFGKELLKILPKFEESQQLLILENKLERSFFAETDRATSSLDDSEIALRKFIASLRDIFNARAALRLREQRSVLEVALSYFLGKGTHLGKSLFTLILQQESSEAACALTATGLMLGEKLKDEISLERALDSNLFRNAMKAFLGDPLGFDIILGFLWHKIAEIRNVSILAKGKVARIRNEKLEQELIHV